MPQPRLIPVTLAALTLVLGVRGAHLWRDADSWFVGAAEAQTAPPAPAAVTGSASQGAPAAVDGGALPDLSRMTKGEMEILQGLAERRQKLDARAREVEMRENLLSAAEKRIDERIAELKRIEASVSAVVKRQEEAQERDVRSLVKVYENMKPKDAARIFEDLDLPILLEVVERMREAKLAPVLALLDPARAQKITVQLAERRTMPAAGRATAKAPAAVRPVGG
jgi:flagellar motility protein MotE (MotC chaperone)